MKITGHPHGLYYSDVVPPPPGSQGKNRIIEVDSTPTPYATILPHATTPTDNPLSGPPTVEAVMGLLWNVAGLWRVIAEGLGFDEDLIDEIYTNNETEEVCLQDCVEQWMRLGPTWQKLAHVLSDMGQNSLSQQAWSRGKHWSCDDSQCSQPSMATQTTSDGFSTSSQQALKGGNSQIVGGCYGQPYNSIGSDASYRGPMAKLSDDLQEQHRATQASVALQEKASDVTTDISTCVSEEEATESEPTTSEESSEQHDSPVLVGGTAHNISSPAMQTSRCCFEDCHLSDSRKIVDENIEVCGNIQRDESGVSSCKNQGVGVTASTHTKPTRRPQCPDTPSTATTAHKIPVGADNADDGTQSSQLPHTEQFNQVNPPFKRNQWNDPPDARKRRLGGPTCSVSQEAVT
jgi:hypothetical protein